MMTNPNEAAGMPGIRLKPLSRGLRNTFGAGTFRQMPIFCGEIVEGELNDGNP
jgi:hypothetical protein